LIKEKAKANKKEISKDEAEKILKDANKNTHIHDHNNNNKKKETKKVAKKESIKEKKPSTNPSKLMPKAKKVSKK